MSLRDLDIAKRYGSDVLTFDDEDTASTDRRCGYSRCAEPLPYSGQGRPPEYCPDRRWDGNRTCKQLAASERAGERAAALDVPLEAFRYAGERFVPAAQALARQLSEVVAAVGDVRDGALSRVGEADRAAATAAGRTRDAETAAARAQSQRVAAEAERDRAVEARRAAEATAATVRKDAETSVFEAWQRVAAADHARGAAETIAVQARRRQEQTEQDRVAQAARHESDLAAVRARAETAEARAQEAETRAQEAETKARVAESRAETADARAAAADARAETVTAALAAERVRAAEAHERSAADLAAARVALAELRREIDRAVATRAVAEQAAAHEAARADRADLRLDRLLRRAAHTRRRAG